MDVYGSWLLGRFGEFECFPLSRKHRPPLLAGFARRLAALPLGRTPRMGTMSSAYVRAVFALATRAW